VANACLQDQKKQPAKQRVRAPTLAAGHTMGRAKDREQRIPQPSQQTGMFVPVSYRRNRSVDRCAAVRALGCTIGPAPAPHASRDALVGAIERCRPLAELRHITRRGRRRNLERITGLQCFPTRVIRFRAWCGSNIVTAMIVIAGCRSCHSTERYSARPGFVHASLNW